MKLQKKYLALLYKIINKATPTKLSDARLRDLFFRKLHEVTAEFEKDEQRIYQELCIKKEDGTPDLTDTKQYQFEGLNAETVLKERDILLAEEVELPDITSDWLERMCYSADYQYKLGESEELDTILSIINGDSPSKTKETANSTTEESSTGDSGESTES